MINAKCENKLTRLKCAHWSFRSSQKDKKDIFNNDPENRFYHLIQLTLSREQQQLTK